MSAGCNLLGNADAVGSRPNAQVRCPHQLQSTKSSTEYITTVYSTLLQALGQAHIVATRVVACGHGDGDDHHLDLNPPDADCSLISNLAASGIWIILQPAMGLKYAPRIPERFFRPCLKPSSFCMAHLQLGIRCGSLIQTPKHAILPSQIECCYRREPPFPGECECCAPPAHSHLLGPAAAFAAQPHSRSLIKLRSFDHLTRASTVIPEVR